MSESSSSKWSMLIFGGLVSIIVGVASGYGVTWLNEKKAELTYSVTSIQAFPGQERIGIVAVKISNSGKKDLENIDVTVRFADAEVKEVLFQGLVPQATNKEKDNIRFQIPFLNATENLTVQILVSPKSEVIRQPSVELRSKGAIGVLADNKAEESHPFWNIVATAAATLVAISTLLAKVGSKKYSVVDIENKKHSDDQRDIFSYVLGLFGLTAESNLVREWPRKLSYWSISDLLTDHWMINRDEKKIQIGIDVFEKIIDYAGVADSSIRIIQLNIAKLYITINDSVSAQKYISMAESESDPVVLKRIKIDPVFEKFTKK
jgi:hypothetical protein